MMPTMREIITDCDCDENQFQAIMLPESGEIKINTLILLDLKICYRKFEYAFKKDYIFSKN